MNEKCSIRAGNGALRSCRDHVDAMALARLRLCDLTCEIAHTPLVWRVFTGD